MEIEEIKKSRLIMVGMDESEKSIEALKWALHHLSTPHDSFLIIHAKRPASSYATAFALSPAYLLSGEMVKIFEDNSERSSQKIFARVVDICRQNYVVPNIKDLTGYAREVLCDAVKSYEPDMLVLGHGGYGAIRRLFFRSVDEYCIHNAQCPIIVVKNLNGSACL